MRSESLLELPIFAYSAARSVHFSLQYQALNALGSVIPDPRRKEAGHERRKRLEPWLDASVRDDAKNFLRRDSQLIASGTYPLSVLMPESPMEHLKRIPRIIADGAAIFSRRNRGRTTEFTDQARDMMADLPRYYQRCFHFQTDGYLSERSASLYEHQVEMLFMGTADAMRRLVLAPLVERFGKTDGRGLRFLEIGAGTGRTTRFVHMLYPKAKIVAIDLSSVYLAQARKQMAGARTVDFLQADAGDLPFSDGQFDAVYNVFMFHELPMEARQQILREARRVLKPEGQGLLALVDSIQYDDKPQYKPLLEQFPVDYHEPFFRDYASYPMQGLVGEAGFSGVETEIGFFSKRVSARS